ncbi:MAG: hypothetical protein OQK63_06180 [Ignavibacteriaceae bacterium]|nr:hypothetical protein [Ignavibacteriaceae bacterium]
MKQVIRNTSLIILSLIVVYLLAQIIADKILIKKAYNGCIDCHGEMEGFTSTHSPEIIGCEACHLGNSFTSNKEFAHKGMIIIPGNLSDAERTCGATNCHPGIPQRIQKSLMNTMSGVISVDRFAFDEIDRPIGLYKIKDLKQSNADNHLRNLCASCHLGNEKTEIGPITELSRGGGCNACHLNYSNKATEQLNNYIRSKEKKESLPKIHPQLSLNISNEHCFGCHARSGRISTNYEGWFETLFTEEEIKTNSHSVPTLSGSESNDEKLKQVQLDNEKIIFRILMDGRVFQKTKDDVHHQAGMECIDCHVSAEIMGDGNLYEHLEEQVRIQCIDCHSNEIRSVSYDQLDFESKKIFNLRNLNQATGKYLTTEKSNIPFINAIVSSSNEKYLITKSANKKLQLKPPAAICVEGKSHERLSCNSCHTEWVYHCVGCHTEYDPNLEGYDLLENKNITGSWVEIPSDFYIDYPVLGVRKEKSGKEIMDTFIPGMVVTLDKLKNNPNKKIFKRLFAPTFSHTINKQGRVCKSCHNNPLAIGYGKGELSYSINGKWKFIPQFSNHKEDNLPKDAWIGFLKSRDETSTTRINTRPFTVEEQKRILLVGACLTCHEEQSEVMKKSLVDFEDIVKNISSKCILPTWN